MLPPAGTPRFAAFGFGGASPHPEILAGFDGVLEAFLLDDAAVTNLFGVGVVALVAFTIIELWVVREPMLNLRLFQNRTFLNATIVGYVTVLALFGAEFLMPVYLQALRGRTA